MRKSDGKALRLLIAVARGHTIFRFPGLITYKEFWGSISNEKWSRGKVSRIVSIVLRITAHEARAGRPPLNEIVVRANTKLPGEPWDSINEYLQENENIFLPYRNHVEAQKAVWKYWANNRGAQKRTQLTDNEVEEGEQKDRLAKFRKRNAKIIQFRKLKDNYSCQACGLRLIVNGTFIVDCHHTRPLGRSKTPVVTNIRDLVCLCPTCHRVAHTRRKPLTPKELKKIGRQKRSPTIFQW